MKSTQQRSKTYPIDFTLVFAIIKMLKNFQLNKKNTQTCIKQLLEMFKEGGTL